MRTNGHAVTEHLLLTDWLTAGIANDVIRGETANDLAALEARRAIATTTQPPLFVGDGEVPHDLWLWPSVARNLVFPLTTVLQLRTRGQQDGIPNWPDGSGSRRPHPLSCSAVEGHHSFAEETRHTCDKLMNNK